jgi:TRAP-type transport system periplasmic protein
MTMFNPHRRALLGFLAAGIVSVSTPSQAQPIVLKVHQQLPPGASIPKNFLKPWAAKIEKESSGRITFQHFDAMQLGGTPPQIFDQARDGVIDIGWTLPGYTANRFPRTETFELPFMATNGEQTSKALWEFHDRHLRDEFREVKLLAIHTNGPYLIHAKGEGVRRLEDMKGLRIRNATRVINKLVAAAGANAIAMPVPQVPEALALNLIDGATMPWEVTTPLRIAEFVRTHTAFSGRRSLNVGVFVLVMNKARYEAMPDDLKAIIDANSGLAASVWAGKVMDEADSLGIEAARKRGNQFFTLDAAETARWRKLAEQVVADWIGEMQQKGIDGRRLIEDAQALMEKHAGRDE